MLRWVGRESLPADLEAAVGEGLSVPPNQPDDASLAGLFVAELGLDLGPELHGDGEELGLEALAFVLSDGPIALNLLV